MAVSVEEDEDEVFIIAGDDDVVMAADDDVSVEPFVMGAGLQAANVPSDKIPAARSRVRIGTGDEETKRSRILCPGPGGVQNGARNGDCRIGGKEASQAFTKRRSSATIGQKFFQECG